MRRFYSANEYFKKIFGEKVYRVSIDAGFTCPNRDGSKGTGGCIYCNAGGSKASYVDSALSIEEQLKRGIDLFKKAKKANKFIAYFQAFSNTYAPVDKLKEIYEIALNNPDIVGISIGTRPDCIDDEKLDYLEEIAEKKLLILEYGIQTLNDKTLFLINRGHSALDSIEAIKKTKRRKKIHLLAHLIFLLPGDNKENMLNFVRKLVEMGVDGFKFHHLYVEKGTLLEKLYNEGKIKLLSLEEYIEILAEVVSFLPESIVIHRLFGECEKENLIAPSWTLNKTLNISSFEKFLEEKNIYQGSSIKIND